MTRGSESQPMDVSMVWLVLFIAHIPWLVVSIINCRRDPSFYRYALTAYIAMACLNFFDYFRVRFYDFSDSMIHVSSKIVMSIRLLWALSAVVAVSIATWPFGLYVAEKAKVKMSKFIDNIVA